MWRQWNIVAGIYILSAYAGMMVACALTILNADDYTSIRSYLTYEVAGISTYITILLLVGICKYSWCDVSTTSTPKPSRRSKKVGNREEKYNEVGDESNS